MIREQLIEDLAAAGVEPLVQDALQQTPDVHDERTHHLYVSPNPVYEAYTAAFSVVAKDSAAHLAERPIGRSYDPKSLGGLLVNAINETVAVSASRKELFALPEVYPPYNRTAPCAESAEEDVLVSLLHPKSTSTRAEVIKHGPHATLLQTLSTLKVSHKLTLVPVKYAGVTLPTGTFIDPVTNAPLRASAWALTAEDRRASFSEMHHINGSELSAQERTATLASVLRSAGRLATNA